MVSFYCIPPSLSLFLTLSMFMLYYYVSTSLSSFCRRDITLRLGRYASRNRGKNSCVMGARLKFLLVFFLTLSCICIVLKLWCRSIVWSLVLLFRFSYFFSFALSVVLIVSERQTTCDTTRYKRIHANTEIKFNC